MTFAMADDRQVEFKLSVVVVSYNMGRELPRTLLSLSHKMQKNISIDDYEIIVVDNGSTEPFDESQCRQIAPNIKIVDNDPGNSVSPASAVNLGLQLAKGQLIGAFIDGARMASPGLLANALSASRLSDNAIIGTCGLHLGHEVQMKSILNGYNQQVEDELLNSVPWQQDGYRLFDISVFAASARRGWFFMISESNALFMDRKLWSDLGGFDERFQSRGGGLINNDLWQRACDLPDSEIILLIGEGTFHQFHGGVATNSAESPIESFKAEYKSIRGHDFKFKNAPFKLFGSLNANHKNSILYSALENGVW